MSNPHLREADSLVRQFLVVMAGGKPSKVNPRVSRVVDSLAIRMAYRKGRGVNDWAYRQIVDERETNITVDSSGDWGYRSFDVNYELAAAMKKGPRLYASDTFTTAEVNKLKQMLEHIATMAGKKCPW